MNEPVAVKSCSCCNAQYSLEAFLKLATPPAGGVQVSTDEDELGRTVYLTLLRNCARCDSTLGVETEVTGGLHSLAECNGGCGRVIESELSGFNDGCAECHAGARALAKLHRAERESVSEGGV